MPLTIDNPILSRRNAHPRDANIQFFDEGHRYHILTDPDTKYTSVTTWAGQHFSHFDADAVIKGMMRGRNWNPANKYWGMTPEAIKDLWASGGAAEAGTNLHYQIECFMNCSETAQTHRELLADWGDTPVTAADAADWGYFLNYIADTLDMRPFRTEWLIYDEELKISGSIDMMYENPADGTLSIYDWKRCKDIVPTMDWPKYSKAPISHMLDCKYWHYALQLNIYKLLIERNYGRVVRDLTLVQIHPTNNNYRLIRLPILDREIAALVAARLHKLAHPDEPVSAAAADDSDSDDAPPPMKRMSVAQLLKLKKR